MTFQFYGFLLPACARHHAVDLTAALDALDVLKGIAKTVGAAKNVACAAQMFGHPASDGGRALAEEVLCALDVYDVAPLIGLTEATRGKPSANTLHLFITLDGANAGCDEDESWSIWILHLVAVLAATIVAFHPDCTDAAAVRALFPGDLHPIDFCNCAEARRTAAQIAGLVPHTP